MIPRRVPLPNHMSGGPKVQISKFPLITKDMDKRTETVAGVGGARPLQSVRGTHPRQAAPEATTPGMIVAKMDDSGKSVVISRPAPPQFQPNANVPKPRVQSDVGDEDPAEPGVPTFSMDHAELCIRLLAEHYKRLEAESAEAHLTEEAAQAITGLFTSGAAQPEAAPVIVAPPPVYKPGQRPGIPQMIQARPGQPMRMVAASPKAVFNGIAPRRTPAVTPVPRGQLPADMQAVLDEGRPPVGSPTGPTIVPADTDLADDTDLETTDYASSQQR